MEEWKSILERLEERNCGVPDHRFYLPEIVWDPQQIPQDVWRRHAAFPSGTKSIKGRKLNGPLDRVGQVWAYDLEENHWDVQDPDEKKLASYDVVSHDGRYIRRGGG